MASHPHRAVVLNVVVPSAHEPPASSKSSGVRGKTVLPAIAVAYRVRARLQQQQRATRTDALEGVGVDQIMREALQKQEEREARVEAAATPEKFPDRTLEMVMCNITRCPDTRGYFQLQMLMLRGNALRDIDALACCTRLRMLDVSFNLLEAIPSTAFWAALTELQWLHLDHNHLGDWHNMLALTAATELALLMVHSNPIANYHNYRLVLANALPAVMAIDGFVITDEELIEGADFGPEFASCCPRMHVPERLLLFDECESEERWLRHLECLLRVVRNLYLCNSPTIQAQRAIRRWMQWRQLGPARHAVVRIQAAMRRFAVAARAWRDLDELLDDADELDLLESSDDESFDPAPDPTTTTAASSAPGDEGKKSKRKRKNDVEHGAARTLQRRFRSCMCTLRHTRTRLERVNDGAVALLFPFELRSAVVEAAAKAMHAYLGAPADGTGAPSQGWQAYCPTAHACIRRGTVLVRRRATELPQPTAIGCDASAAVECRLTPLGGATAFRRARPITSALAETRLRRRGCAARRDANEAARRTASRWTGSGARSFRQRAEVFFVFAAPQPAGRILARVARELRSRDPHTLILLDGHARRAAAAQTVQACVRSYGARLRIEPPMVARALSRRAAVCLQRWWRMQPFRERWQLIDALRSVSAAITSAQFYLEADTFFMLTNHAQAQRVRSTLPPAPFADEFGFLPSGQVVLRARALGRGIPNWVPGRPPRHELHECCTFGALPIRNARISLECELLPATCAQPPGLPSPKPGDRVPMLPSNRPADCVRLILVRLDSVLEARRRAMLLTLCTWDRRRRNAVSVFSRAMLEHCRQQRLRPVSDTGSSPFGLPTAVPSTWLKRARALNQAEKLQFEIMCQLHSSAVVQDSGSFSARRADEHYRTDDAVVPHRPLSARSFVTKQSHRKYQLARPDASDPELEPQRMEVPVIRTGAREQVDAQQAALSLNLEKLVRSKVRYSHAMHEMEDKMRKATYRKPCAPRTRLTPLQQAELPEFIRQKQMLDDDRRDRDERERDARAHHVQRTRDENAQRKEARSQEMAEKRAKQAEAHLQETMHIEDAMQHREQNMGERADGVRHRTMREKKKRRHRERERVQAATFCQQSSMMARHAREVSHSKAKDHREEALRRDVKVTKDTNAYRRQRVLSMLEAKFERKRIDAAAQQVELQAQLKLVEELGKPVRRDQEWAFSSTAPGTLAKALDYLMPIADPQELAGVQEGELA